jgi:hypothetical protein
MPTSSKSATGGNAASVPGGSTVVREGVTLHRPMSVHQAIAAVMGELPNIGKDDRSPEGFNFRGIEAMTRHVQPLLAKHGLVIVPSARLTRVVAAPAMKEGWQDVYVEVSWTIVGPDGSQLTARTNGIGRDRVDRGASKAQTQAYKYLLLHLLCVSDGKDEGDAQTYEGDRTEGEDREDPAVPGLRSSIEGAIVRMSDDEKADLKAWFAANGLPAVRRMNAAQCDAVIDHLMRIHAIAEFQPRRVPEPAEGGDDGS